MAKKQKKQPQRIAFAMTKGGATKTTSAVAIATELAEKGNKVLLIDTDTQALVKHALGALGTEFGLYELADGEPFENVVYRFARQKASVMPRINLDVVVNKGNLNKLTMAWTLAEEDREGQFAELMERVEEVTDYDYILVDTSPTEGMINTNVFYYVHQIFCPVVISSYHVLGLEDFIDIIEKTKLKKAKRKDSKLEISWILPTRLDKRKRTGEALLQQIHQIAKDRIPKAKVLEPIPECAKTDECAIFNKSILEYDRNSRGGQGYLKAFTEVFNER